MPHRDHKIRDPQDLGLPHAQLNICSAEKSLYVGRELVAISSPVRTGLLFGPALRAHVSRVERVGHHDEVRPSLLEAENDQSAIIRDLS